MHHEVVAGARPDGHGGTCQDTSRMHRPQHRSAGTHEIHGVTYVGHRKFSKAVDDFDADLCATREHSKADSHWMTRTQSAFVCKMTQRSPGSDRFKNAPISWSSQAQSDARDFGYVPSDSWAMSLPKSAGVPGSGGGAQVGKYCLHLGIGEC
jgi:hypothetical protein